MSPSTMLRAILVTVLSVGLLACVDPEQAVKDHLRTSSQHPKRRAAEKTPTTPSSGLGGENNNHSLTGPGTPEITSAAAASAPADPPPSNNWPRFRGPAGDGVSRDTGLPVEWSADKNILWRTELPGPGSSSPIVYDGRVFVTCYSGYGVDATSPGKLVELKRHLVCLDGNEGRILWTATMPAAGDESPFTDIALQLHGYATHTPAADETGVYVFYGATGAAAYSHEGELQWHVRCGSGNHQWGSSSSIVLYEDLVIINAELEDRSLVALAKGTGDVVWRTRSDNPWHTPSLVSINGSVELVLNASTRKTVLGVDPSTGTKLWSVQTPFIWNIPATVAQDGTVYVTDGAGANRTIALHAGGRGDVTATHKLWEAPVGSRLSSPVYHNGFLFLVKDEGNIVCCVDCRDGSVVYKERLKPGSGRIFASPIIADGKLYYVSREHGAYVLAAQPQFALLAHNTIESDKSVFNGSPAVTGGRLLLRSNRFLYCIGTMK